MSILAWNPSLHTPTHGDTTNQSSGALPEHSTASSQQNIQHQLFITNLWESNWKLSSKMSSTNNHKSLCFSLSTRLGLPKTISGIHVSTTHCWHNRQWQYGRVVAWSLKNHALHIFSQLASFNLCHYHWLIPCHSGHWQEQVIFIPLGFLTLTKCVDLYHTDSFFHLPNIPLSGMEGRHGAFICHWMGDCWI